MGALGDDDYQTDIEIKRLEQYSPELNKLNKEDIKDLRHRPNIQIEGGAITNMHIAEGNQRLNGVNLSAFSGDQ